MNWLLRDSEEAREEERERIDIKHLYRVTRLRTDDFQDQSAADAVSSMHRELARRKAHEDLWVSQQCMAEETAVSACEKGALFKFLSVYQCTEEAGKYVKCRDDNRVRSSPYLCRIPCSLDVRAPLLSICAHLLSSALEVFCSRSRFVDVCSKLQKITEASGLLCKARHGNLTLKSQERSAERKTLSSLRQESNGESWKRKSYNLSVYEHRMEFSVQGGSALLRRALALFPFSIPCLSSQIPSCPPIFRSALEFQLTGRLALASASNRLDPCNFLHLLRHTLNRRYHCNRAPRSAVQAGSMVRATTLHNHLLELLPRLYLHEYAVPFNISVF